MENHEKRINRIIGQLQGIGKMIDTERDVIEILHQISAVKKAVDGLSKDLVTYEIANHTPTDARMQTMIDLLIRV